MRARELERREASPTAGVVDSQSVKQCFGCKFNFRYATSKSRRSVKAVLEKLEWQLSGLSTIFNMSECSARDNPLFVALFYNLPSRSGVKLTEMWIIQTLG